jgi:hypothetical protein
MIEARTELPWPAIRGGLRAQSAGHLTPPTPGITTLFFRCPLVTSLDSAACAD